MTDVSQKSHADVRQLGYDIEKHRISYPTISDNAVDGYSFREYSTITGQGLCACEIRGKSITGDVYHGVFGD